MMITKKKHSDDRTVSHMPRMNPGTLSSSPEAAFLALMISDMLLPCFPGSLVYSTSSVLWLITFMSLSQSPRTLFPCLPPSNLFLGKCLFFPLLSLSPVPGNFLRMDTYPGRIRERLRLLCLIRTHSLFYPFSRHGSLISPLHQVSVQGIKAKSLMEWRWLDHIRLTVLSMWQSK